MLFALACMLPAVDAGRSRDFGALQDRYDNSPEVSPGCVVLATGWMSCHPAWLANPVLALRALLLRLGRSRCAAAAGALSAALGLSTWGLLGSSELHAGYYVWQAIQFALTAGAGWACLLQREVAGAGLHREMRRTRAGLPPWPPAAG